MVASFLTAICFAISITSASQSSRLIGAAAANFSRMLVGLLALALYAFILGTGFGGGVFGWFVLSGLLGFGLGDVALYLALPRIGPRLTILLTQCLAAPFAALIERVWLGTVLSGGEMICGAVVLGGVALALSPSGHLVIARADLWAGSLFGTLAALGQALGAVVSRKAYAEALTEIDGGTAAFQRMTGGIAIAALFFLLVRLWHLRRPLAAETAKRMLPARERWRRAAGWIVLNGMIGPAIGVGLYQWALRTTPSAIVLPIVALSPVMTIPFTVWLEGDRPSARSLVGAAIAVAAAAALTQL